MGEWLWRCSVCVLEILFYLLWKFLFHLFILGTTLPETVGKA